MPALPHQLRVHAALFSLALLALAPTIAQAQLYTWKDEQGNITIRNSPPPWYSQSERSRGARVQVLRNGKVVDDTAWPAERRQEGLTKAARQEEERVKAERAAAKTKKDEDED